MGQRNTTRDTQRNGDGSEQFDRFEQLTRRLFSVPKQEADQQRSKKNGKKNR